MKTLFLLSTFILIFAGCTSLETIKKQQETIIIPAVEQIQNNQTINYNHITNLVSGMNSDNDAQRRNDKIRLVNLIGESIKSSNYVKSMLLILFENQSKSEGLITQLRDDMEKTSKDIEFFVEEVLGPELRKVYVKSNLLEKEIALLDKKIKREKGKKNTDSYNEEFVNDFIQKRKGKNSKLASLKKVGATLRESQKVFIENATFFFGINKSTGSFQQVGIQNNN